MHQELISQASTILGEFQLAQPGLTAGSVSCALMTRKGTVYTGICLDLACGIGFCAEHAAIAEMLKARETAIDSIVAIKSTGAINSIAVNSTKILMPCGRCRELMVQVSQENFRTKVIVDDSRFILLSDLLPQHWL